MARAIQANTDLVGAEMKARGWSYADLASAMRTTEQTARNVVDGNSLSAAVVYALHNAFDGHYKLTELFREVEQAADPEEAVAS